MDDLRHLLVLHMPGEEIEARVEYMLFSLKGRSGATKADLGRFGKQTQRAAAPKADIQRVRRRRRSTLGPDTSMVAILGSGVCEQHQP
ncbi:MAG: hypothetical protein HIU89_00110 [Proteobacteria bacterium]|nr:hypothetical protein [Pseudomonadota bacterium]